MARGGHSCGGFVVNFIGLSLLYNIAAWLIDLNVVIYLSESTLLKMLDVMMR
jgi:hypothetical protein